MKRIVFLIAFFFVTTGANAQVADTTAPLRTADSFNPTHAMVSGTSLPTEPLSREAMPYVLVFSYLSPLRAAEAVGLGVTAVMLIDNMHRESDYDGESSRGSQRSPRSSLFRGRSHPRAGYIFRHY